MAWCVRSKPSLLCISPYRSTRGCAPLVWLNSLQASQFASILALNVASDILLDTVVRHRSDGKAKLECHSDDMSGHSAVSLSHRLLHSTCHEFAMQLTDGKERQFWFCIPEIPHALMCMDGAETYDIPNICMDGHA